MIYFIQDSKNFAIKIGFTATDNHEVRRNACQTGNPNELVFLGSIPGDRSREGELHRQFAKFRLCGEWFHPAPAILQLIMQSATKETAPCDSQGQRLAIQNGQPWRSRPMSCPKCQTTRLTWCSVVLNTRDGGVVPCSLVSIRLRCDNDHQFVFSVRYCMNTLTLFRGLYLAEPPTPTRSITTTVEDPCNLLDWVAIWPLFVQDAGSMLAANLSKAETLQVTPSREAIFSFAHKYAQAAQYVSNPERTERIKTSIEKQTGRRWDVIIKQPPPQTQGH